MAHDITISPTASPLPSPEAQDRAAVTPDAAPVVAKLADASPTALFANPTLQLNAGLGIVVIEFRDSAGNVTSQIPTQRQIEAYQTGSAAMPDAAHDPTATAAIASAATATAAKPLDNAA